MINLISQLKPMGFESLSPNLIKEECGVFGVYNKDGNCAQTVYYGLYALQHRGEEACGIATVNDLELSCHKGKGLVGEVFTESILNDLGGTMAIGHVLYNSVGKSRKDNTQPLALKYIKGSLAVAHNGALTNAAELKREFEYKGAVFHTTTDSEVIAYAIAQARLHSGSAEAAVSCAMKQLRGAFSLVVMSSQKLIAARDPWGFRPLCIGKKGDAYFFVSESCALDSIGATFVRDVKPGEIVWVYNGELFSDTENCQDKTSLCIFEHLYIARPDSVIDGQSVYDARIIAGRYLAREFPIDADVVIGPPDTGLIAAKGYALETGIPYNDGFIKNRYIGRTFIAPQNVDREEIVKIKLNPLKTIVNGKRVVVVDDSIVNGVTVVRTVKLLRDCGAKEIHMLSSAPKCISTCNYGTDFTSKENLFANKYTDEEMLKITGADSLHFLSIENLKNIAPDSACDFCDACYTENYPVV